MIMRKDAETIRKRKKDIELYRTFYLIEKENDGKKWIMTT